MMTDNLGSIPPYSAPPPRQPSRRNVYIIACGVAATCLAVVGCVAAVIYLVFNAEELLANDRSYSEVVWLDDDRMVLLRDGGPTFNYTNSLEDKSYENGRGIDVVNVARGTRETIAFTDSAELFTAAGSGSGEVACAGPGVIYWDCVSDDNRVWLRPSDDVTLQNGEVRLRYNRDGSHLMIINDGGVYLLERSGQYQSITLNDVAVDVVAAAWHPDGVRVALLASNGRLLVVGYTDTAELVTYFSVEIAASLSSEAVGLVWQDAQRLVVVTDTQLLQWDINARSTLDEANRGDYLVAPTALPDGSLVLARGDEIAIWNTGLDPVRTFSIAADRVEQVEVNPSGTRVAIFGRDDDSRDKVWAYSLETGEQLWSR